MLSFGSLFLGGRLIPFGGGNCFVLFPSGFGLSLGNGLGGLGGVDLMWLDHTKTAIKTIVKTNF
jgi:hypothetical protein